MPRFATEDDRRLSLRMRLRDNSERIVLSERDSLRIFKLLENPPAPNSRLLAAAQALPQRF